MVFNMASSPARSDTDIESEWERTELVFKLGLNFRPGRTIIIKALKLAASHPGVQSVWAGEIDKKFAIGIVGEGLDAIQLVKRLKKKIWLLTIVSVDHRTARKGTFPTTERITKLQPIEDTNLERKRSLGILICEEQPEQSENQQEDQPPPGQAVPYISQEELPLSYPLPPLSLPLASEAQPSSSTVSRPSQGMSDQMQASPDHAPEFPFTPSSSRIFLTESLADMLSHSSISPGACLLQDTKLVEEKGLEGHDQLYDSAVHHLLSGIDGIVKLKRRLEEAANTAIMLHKQVEELEAKVSMVNKLERWLRDMLSISEERHAGTKRELAHMREKMDAVNRRIEYLENEKAEEKVFRARIEGETMSTPRPSPAAPRSISLTSVPSPSPRLTGLEVCKESALFPELTSYLDKS